MTKDQWMIEYERIGEEYVAGQIDRDEAMVRLRAIGFDADEIDDHLSSLDEDRNNQP